MAELRFVACPRCGVQVAWSAESRFRPFCSQRCKLVDLADWATERYRIAEPERNDEPPGSPD